VEFVVVGMVVVGKDKIVVENKIVDMDDMMFGDCREDGFHKWVLTNLVEKVGFDPTEEAMPAKVKGYSKCFVQIQIRI
jgi:hypothetical protein